MMCTDFNHDDVLHNAEVIYDSDDQTLQHEFVENDSEPNYGEEDDAHDEVDKTIIIQWLKYFCEI